MSDDLPNKKDEYFEFDDTVSLRKFGNLFSSLKKENFVLFLRPLFIKLPNRESWYWTVFFIVALCSTGAILNFIDIYARDMVKYQSTLTSVGRYHSVVQEMSNKNTTL